MRKQLLRNPNLESRISQAEDLCTTYPTEDSNAEKSVAVYELRRKSAPIEVLS